jgi:hypothetical protein
MKWIVSLVSFLIFFAACKKQEVYHAFTSQEEDFISYRKDQPLKFVDTSGVTQTLSQLYYRREYLQVRSGFLPSGIFYEWYNVDYFCAEKTNFSLGVSASAPPYHWVEINFELYNRIINLDSLPEKKDNILINGSGYNGVYRMKMNKGYGLLNTADTATLFYNKEYGVIQLLFPNGKSITRTN